MMNLQVPEERELPVDVAVAQRQQLLSEVERDLRPSSVNRWRRATFSAAAAVVILLVAAPVIARWYAEPVVEDETIGCYEMLGDQGTVAVVNADGRSPEAICADLWRNGEMTRGTTDVPPLTTCVTEEGGAPAVLPSSDPDVCEREGMRNLGDSHTAYERELITLRDKLHERLPNDRCFTFQEMSAIARDVVRDLGMDSWTVKANETATMELPSGRDVEFRADCYSWSIGGENETREIHVYPFAENAIGL